MHILVKTMRGKMVSVKVEGSDTFDIVNAKVRAMEGIIPPDSPNIQYIYNLNDDMDPTCRPAPWGMIKLFVRRFTTGETFTVFVFESATIMDLKHKIWDEAKSDCKPHCQKLFFTGIMLKNDHKTTLADYNICGDSTIDLFLDYGGKLILFIETLSGKKVSLPVYISYTVSKVKTLIQDKEGIPSERQKLVYAGQQLDDSLKLQDYILQSTSVVLLLNDEDDMYLKTERTLCIHVNIVATGTSVELDVKSTDTVDHVKSMIQEKEDIPANQQTLFLPQMQLKDGVSLDKYYIRDNSTLDLVQTVELPEGEYRGKGDHVGLTPCSNLERKFPKKRKSSHLG